MDITNHVLDYIASEHPSYKQIPLEDTDIDTKKLILGNGDVSFVIDGVELMAWGITQAKGIIDCRIMVAEEQS